MTSSAELGRFPKVEVLELREDEIKFLLSDTDISVANALRRVMIAEVPTLAIDLVEVKENSTVLHDEFLAHRLGLIPLQAPTKLLRNMKYTWDCECDAGCGECEVVFNLDVTLSLSHSQQVKVISSADLISENEAVKAVQFTSQKERDNSHDKGIRLCTIGKGQRLQIRCVARKGIGKNHAKWQPVSTAVFQHEPDVKINNARMDEFDEEQRKEFVERCPTKVFRYTSNSKVAVTDHKLCVMCNECVQLSDDLKKHDETLEDAVTIGMIPQRFYFTVESTGAMPPQDIVSEAIWVLQGKLDVLKSELDKKKGQTAEVEVDEGFKNSKSMNW